MIGEELTLINAVLPNKFIFRCYPDKIIVIQRFNAHTNVRLHLSVDAGQEYWDKLRDNGWFDEVNDEWTKPTCIRTPANPLGDLL